MRPSPARAQAPEPRAWLPLVDLADLPALEELLAPDRLVDSGQTRALQGHDVARWAGRPSPARAQAPEPRAWLPLVDLADLPALEELLAPDRLVDSGQTRALRDLRELDDPALVPRPVPAVPPLRRPGADEGAGEPAAGPEPPPASTPPRGPRPPSTGPGPRSAGPGGPGACATAWWPGWRPSRSPAGSRSSGAPLATSTRSPSRRTGRS
ncbi:MAG: hypothetical protein M5U14_17765 [Acidimicrobiia bacterium]|nr:hypothetical protein [Acidimicrobiia bacterium]